MVTLLPICLQHSKAYAALVKRVCGPAILLLDDLRLHLPLPLALLFFLLNFFLFGHGKLSLQLILGRVVVVHVPGLRIPSGERGVALATDEAVDGAPLQVPRLTGRLLNPLSPF